METISQQSLHQRLRKRVIGLLEMHSSCEDIAVLGAFKMINLVDELLPLDYDQAPGVFSDSEKRALAEFLRLSDIAAEETDEDTWDVAWFKASNAWGRLSEFAQDALAVFSERGCFPEGTDDIQL